MQTLDDRCLERASKLNEQRRWTLSKMLACLLACILGGVVLAVIGMVVGATYGGNYEIDFEFDGARGYEATGKVGAILGIVAGCSLGALLFCLLSKRQ